VGAPFSSSLLYTITLIVLLFVALPCAIETLSLSSVFGSTRSFRRRFSKLSRCGGGACITVGDQIASAAIA
jgi:hypothetical protein